MNQRAMIAATAATLMSLTLVAAPAVAQEKEKCFGIAKAGQNDCASINGSHSCASLRWTWTSKSGSTSPKALAKL